MCRTAVGAQVAHHDDRAATRRPTLVPRAPRRSRPADADVATMNQASSLPCPELAVLRKADESPGVAALRHAARGGQPLLRVIAFAEKPDYASVAPGSRLSSAASDPHADAASETAPSPLSRPPLGDALMNAILTPRPARGFTLDDVDATPPRQLRHLPRGGRPPAARPRGTGEVRDDSGSARGRGRRDRLELPRLDMRAPTTTAPDAVTFTSDGPA